MSKARKSEALPAATPHGGRPKGAGAIERPTSVAVLARCPRCKGTKHRCQKGAGPVVHRIDGVSKTTGEPYRFVVWRNVICQCGQHFRIREETNHDPRETPF